MRKTRPVSIATVLERSFKGLNMNALLLEYRVKKAWPEAVGGIISRKTRVRRLMGKTLHVDVSSQPWTTELVYQKADIIKRMNDVMGGPAVQDIVFRPGMPGEEPDEGEKAPVLLKPLSMQESGFIEKTVEGVADPSLRDSIKRAMEKSLSSQ